MSDKKTKFTWKSYWEPTPKRIRRFGDSLAAAGTLGAGIAVLNGHPIVGTVVMVAAVVGKFISNFFSEEPVEEQTNNDGNE